MSTVDHARPLLYTIGHSSLSADQFLRALDSHAVRIVLDVRSQPHSSRYPHFGKTPLAEELRLAGRAYRWLGGRLGGRPQDSSLLTPSGEPDWEQIVATSGFEAGITEASVLATGARGALLCSEGDPSQCHRDRILAPRFEADGFTVLHILPDGSLRPYQQSLGI